MACWAFMFKEMILGEALGQRLSRCEQNTTSIFYLDQLTSRRIVDGRIAGNEQLAARMGRQDSALDQRTGKDTLGQVTIGNQRVASGRAGKSRSWIS